MQPHDNTPRTDRDRSPEEELRHAKRLAIQARYRAAHHAELLEKGVQYRESCREELRQRNRQYYAAQGDAIRERARNRYPERRESEVARLSAYRKAHPEKELVYRQAHREEAKARAKDWYHAHKQRAKITRRTYWITYRMRAKERYEQHRRDHLAEIQARERTRSAGRRGYHRDWARRHPEYYRARVRAWVKANPERAKANGIAGSQAYRARKYAAKTEKIYRQAIYERDRGICGICGKHVAAAEVSLDHILPLSQGGSHTHDNVQIAHKRCNSRKGAGRIPSQLRLPLLSS